MKRLSIAALALMLVLAIGAYAYQGERAGEAQVPFNAAHGDLTLEQATRFSDFTLYSLGGSFEGFDLAAITQRDDAANPQDAVRAEYVGFIYGDCEAGSDDGCAPPLEVRSGPPASAITPRIS